MEETVIVDVPEQTVLGIRKAGHYTSISELLPAIARYAGKKEIQILGPPLFLMHETSPEEVRKAGAEGTADLEVAFPVPEGTLPGPGMEVYTLPGGMMARTFHRGPYEAAEPVYLRFFAWLEEKGLAITGPVREVYINDPRVVAPEEILTEIQAPVA